jgi:hypothetical protein
MGSNPNRSIMQYFSISEFVLYYGLRGFSRKCSTFQDILLDGDNKTNSVALSPQANYTD